MSYKTTSPECHYAARIDEKNKQRIPGTFKRNPNIYASKYTHVIEIKSDKIVKSEKITLKRFVHEFAENFKP